MNAHWAERYIGAPYDEQGIGDDAHAFNCWGLVRYVQNTHYGRAVPLIPVDPGAIRAVLTAFASHPEHGRWAQVAAPAEGDVVALSRGVSPHHCGLWIDADNGGVLHALVGAGVCFDAPGALALGGWNITAYWRYQGPACTR